MRIVPAGENTELVGGYVAEKVGIPAFTSGMFQAFAILKDGGEFWGGVVVSNFRGSDCELSIASEHALAWRPNSFKVVFEYIFNQLGCARVTCITTKRNKRARAFMEKSGFVLEGNIRLGYDGKRDALIYGLLARDSLFHLAGGLASGEEIGA